MFPIYIFSCTECVFSVFQLAQVLCYLHHNGAALVRSSQPKPGIKRSRCQEDEQLLQAVVWANPINNQVEFRIFFFFFPLRPVRPSLCMRLHITIFVSFVIDV
jgi:hypothetical protein